MTTFFAAIALASLALALLARAPWLPRDLRITFIVLAIIASSLLIISDLVPTLLRLGESFTKIAVVALAGITCVQLARCFTRSRSVQVGTSTTCQVCGYDLSTASNAPCPECGTAHAQATAVYAPGFGLSPHAFRIALSWSIAAAIAMLASPVGSVIVGVRYIARGIPLSAAVQLAQQYEGNEGSPLLSAWPFTLSALASSLIYQWFGARRAWRRVWLLIPLGVAASCALRLFV